MARNRKLLQPGDRFGQVTVLSTRPTVFQCACGKVFKRMPFAVYSSKNPSCGCLQRALKSERRSESPNYVLIEQLPPTDVKAVYAKFLVACRRCNARFHVSNAQLLSPKLNPYGCRFCLAGYAPT